MATLTPELLAAFGISKTFRENSRVNSIDCFRDGTIAAVGGESDLLCVYNCVEGSLQTTIKCREIGVDCVRFTHNPNAVLHASRNGWDETVRYLALHDQTYIRYFRGHRDRVTSIKMSPVSDTFLTASRDGTVRMWDLRMSSCQAKLETRSTPCIGFDPEGVLFSICDSSETEPVKLYDLRSYDNGPFSSWKVPTSNPNPPRFVFSDVTFSNDGLHMVLQTANGVAIMVDAYDGKLEREFVGHKNEYGVGLPVAFSPDAALVSIGSEDGSVFVWSIATPSKPPTVLRGHTDAVSALSWNPKLMMFMTASEVLHMWLPAKSAFDEQ